jgi:peptide/nickel transport system substrate-binding protein
MKKTSLTGIFRQARNAGFPSGNFRSHYAGTAIALILAFLCALPAAAGGKRDAGQGAAASPSASPGGGELRYAFTTEPATLDPLSSTNTADGRSILFNVFEGLLKPTPDGGLEPAVAQSYRVEQNGLIYVFVPRSGLTFHDGSAVTPEDIEFSVNTAIAAGYLGLDQINAVEKTSAGEIRISLKAQDLEFGSYLTFGVVPKANADREHKPIGTGPFSIESYDPQQSLVLKKNPSYWKPGVPRLDKITYVFVADSSARLLALQGSSVDAGSITGPDLDQLPQDKFHFEPGYSNSAQLLALNNAVKPLDDKGVRQAINYAVDLQEIIDAAFFGRGEPSGSPLIPALKKYYNESLKNPYPRDIAKAQSLLAAAGLSGGFPLEITVPSNYTMHVDTAQVLADQLAKINIRVSIKLVDWATWLSGVYRDRNYQATIISLDSASISPRSFLTRYRSDNGSNFINFKSTAFDRVYDASLTELDEAKRIALYKEAQKIISDEAASVYIQDIIGYTAWPKNYAGFVHYPLYTSDFSTVYRTR